MIRTWFVSDLHLHHTNILRYEPIRIKAVADYYRIQYPKDDSDVEATIKRALDENDRPMLEFIMTLHDEMLIKNWNQTISAQDTVWFLGDLMMGNRTRAQELISKLNGHKRMITGNHDNFPRSFYESYGFEYVSKYPIILKGKFILSHAPLPNWTEDIPLFNIYGHVHSNTQFTTHTNNSQCVCVERQEFKPIQIVEFDKYNPEEMI